MTDTNYFVIECFAEVGDAQITTKPILPKGYDNWYAADIIPDNTIQEPLEHIIEAEHEGEMRPFFKALSAPLMSESMISVLKSSGVDNLQVFDAVVKVDQTGEVIQSYKAVNIVGLIEVADLGESEYEVSPLDESPMYSTSFESLVVDEEKANGALFFRMAESVDTILVHKSVKEALETLFPRLDFIEPEDYSN